MNKIFKNFFPNTKNTFYKYTIKHFAISMSFKNKINSLFKHVHPDILGMECPSEFRKTNESSVQDLNNYLESLDKGNKFLNQNIDFYIKIEEKDKNEKLHTTYSKLSVNLEQIDPNTSQTNRITLQLK